MKIKTITLIALILLSCNDNNNTPPDDQPYRGLIPAAIGNYWIYADSIWINQNLTSVKFDTVEIVEIIMRDSITWWQLSGWELPYLRREFAVINDSVYSWQIFFSQTFKSLVYIPPPDTMTVYESTISGDILIYRTAELWNEPIELGLGTFHDCGRYTVGEIAMGAQIEEFIAPGVGIIFVDWIRDSTWAWPYNYHQKMVLVDYDVSNSD
ncbi:MAG: hypothetical protein IIB95_03595 [Candidatus Marinimicrobia bacterium]|nr:hypothetical protein [Candidatus Neomarinimicrobiota bacterium]